MIALDGMRPETWRVDVGAVHIYRGRLWTLEEAGCMVCIREGQTGPTAHTLRAVDAREFVCLTHGPLVEIPLKITRKYNVFLGNLTKEATESYSDSILIAACLSDEEQQAALEELLREIDQAERDVPIVV